MKVRIKKSADAFNFFLSTVGEKYEIWGLGSGVDKIQVSCDATKCPSWDGITLQNTEKNDAVTFLKDSFFWKIHGIEVVSTIKAEIKSQIYLPNKKTHQCVIKLQLQFCKHVYHKFVSH
jgi:hypothetical protein